MNFVDNNTDLHLINYLAKSLPHTVIQNALVHTGLVEKEVPVHTKNGVIMEIRYVKADNSVPNKSGNTAVQRKQLPATPHNITERTKHLVAVQPGSALPEHIQKLQLPPSWRNVMISPDPNAELLAIGKDDMDRTQYVYHPDFVKAKSAAKFQRVAELMKKRQELVKFIQKLHKIDPDTSDCLNLILHMGLRPGSTKDTKSKVEAIGATTLRGEHVIKDGSKVFLRFIGKKGVNQDHEVTDPTLKRMLLRRKKAAGNSGDLFDTTSSKLRAVMPPGIHPKDLRTMLATYSAQEFLISQPSVNNLKEFVKLRNATGDYVSSKLGNQRTMALNSYIDPSVFQQHSPEGYQQFVSKEASKS